MRKKSTYVVLLIILLVFFVVMFLTFGIKNIREGKYGVTLIVGDNTIWSYNNRKWNNITSSASVQKLNWEKYKVFENNEEKGEYSLWHDDKWYAFDDEKNAINIDGNLLAYRANFNMKVYPFKEEKIDSMDYVAYVLEENNISTSSKFTTSYKVHFDFDNDGVNEDFYLVSNAFPMDFDPETIFSLVFMVKDNQIYYIYNDVSENRSFNGCKPFFTSFLDVNNDNTYEFVLSCGRYSIEEQVDMLYQFEDGAFKIIISSQ